MKVPLRFKVLRAWLASFISKSPTSGSITLGQMMRYLLQKGKMARGMQWLSESGTDSDGDRWFLIPKWNQRVFYPSDVDSAELMASIHLIFDSEDWHHYWCDDWRPCDTDIVVDCGAAEGLFAMSVLNYGCKVYAFEPMPNFQRVFSKSVSNSSLGKSVLIGKAVGHKEGTVSFGGGLNGAKISSEGEYSVNLCSLDHELHYEKGRISMIKADIEGFEYDMLLGAQAIIEVHKPRLSITVYHDQNNISQIRDYLLRCHKGYKIHTVGLELNGNPVMMFAIP